MSKTYRVVVLNDGQTYSDIDGTAVLTIEMPDGIEDEAAAIEDAVQKARELVDIGAAGTIGGVKVTVTEWIEERYNDEV